MRVLGVRRCGSPAPAPARHSVSPQKRNLPNYDDSPGQSRRNQSVGGSPCSPGADVGEGVSPSSPGADVVTVGSESGGVVRPCNAKYSRGSQGTLSTFRGEREAGRGGEREGRGEKRERERVYCVVRYKPQEGTQSTPCEYPEYPCEHSEYPM